MAIAFVGYLALTIIAERLSKSLAFAKFVSKVKSCYKTRTQEVTGEDEMVKNEKKRVAAGVPGALLTIKDVEKDYGRVWAVRGISIACSPGEVFGLLGLNGAGKTSALKACVGGIAADKGTITINGFDVQRQLDRCRQFMGYCPQNDAITDELSVLEHLTFYAKLKGIKLEQIPAECAKLIDLLGLRKFTNTRAGTLSGGNKRKLLAAISLIGDPPVVFMDEPSSGMDPMARRFMWSVIQKIASEKKRTIVITTHSMEEAEALSTKIAIMASGRFRCLGTVTELKNLYGAGFELNLRVKLPTEIAMHAVTSLWGVEDSAVMKRADCQRICAGLSQARLEVFTRELGGLDENIAAKVFAEWWVQADFIDEVRAFIPRVVPGTVSVMDAVGRVLKFLIKDCRSVLDIFESIENNKSQVNIDEYSISQFSLEQIFNDFARGDSLARQMTLLE
jgi:ABC-type multidrug transport system ATPase subunit